LLSDTKAPDGIAASEEQKFGFPASDFFMDTYIFDTQNELLGFLLVICIAKALQYSGRTNCAIMFTVFIIQVTCPC
jgi:hypothetical protein